MKKTLVTAILAVSSLIGTSAKAQSRHWHSINSNTDSVSVPANSVITYIGVNVGNGEGGLVLETDISLGAAA